MFGLCQQVGQSQFLDELSEAPREGILSQRGRKICTDSHFTYAEENRSSRDV